jgi:hypothetical protein
MLNTYDNNGQETSFNYNVRTNNLQITTLKNIPLSKAGSQFKMVTSSSANLFASNTVPLILPNTSLANSFAGCVNFDQSIDNWNMLNVTNMSYMFATQEILSAPKIYFPTFNQSISNWNTSNVTNMSYMFSGNENFKNGNNALTLNAKKVTNMSYMFEYQTYYDGNKDKDVNTASPFNQQMTLTDLNVNDLIYIGWHSGAADLTVANAPIQLRVDPFW